MILHRLILVAIVIMLTGAAFYLLPIVITRGASRWNKELARYVAHTAAFLVLTIGLSAALGLLLPTVSLFSAGTIGLAVGLSLQGIMSNVVDGGMLAAEHRWDIGDWLQIGDYTGQLEDLGARVATLRTPTGDNVWIPNNVLMSTPVLRLGKTRLAQMQQEATHDPTL